MNAWYFFDTCKSYHDFHQYWKLDFLHISKSIWNVSALCKTYAPINVMSHHPHRGHVGILMNLIPPHSLIVYDLAKSIKLLINAMGKCSHEQRSVCMPCYVLPSCLAVAELVWGCSPRTIANWFTLPRIPGN